MMFRYDAKKILNDVENNIKHNDSREIILSKLRKLSFTDFSLLLLNIPNDLYPKLSDILPNMASDKVQKQWTGLSGVELLKQSIDFVHTLVFNISTLKKIDLKKAKVLDFGCGYARIIRLLYYFINENNLYGVDPWDLSIKICNDDGLNKNIYLSEYLPNKLPFKGINFDIIYAFSVYTHLSERATVLSLNTLKNYLTKNGIIVITIRPIEYWDLNISRLSLEVVNKMKSMHIENGFTFNPHQREKIDGDITYGDTSMSLEWIEINFPDLKIIKTDYSLSDKYQTYVFLEKK